MQLLSWLRKRTTGRPQTRRTTECKPNPGFRPRLEALEDRCLPSTLTVTSAADDINQRGTLRYDVARAQSGDTILLTGAVKSGIVLTQGELLLNQNVTITSAGNHQIMISGDGLSRVLEVASGAQVFLSNLILTGGDGVASPTSKHPNDGFGGALLVDFGSTLTVRDSTVFGNSASSVAGSGGGGVNFGTLTIRDSTLCGNSSSIRGGAVANRGTLSVYYSVLSDNSVVGASGSGGAIYNQGMVNVSDSILSGNSVVGARAFGGAIFNRVGTATVSDSILSGNAAANGGAVFNSRGAMTVSGCTIAGNSATAGGGIYNFSGTVTVENSSSITGNAASVVGADVYNLGVLFLDSTSTIGILDGNPAIPI